MISVTPAVARRGHIQPIVIASIKHVVTPVTPIEPKRVIEKIEGCTRWYGQGKRLLALHGDSRVTAVTRVTRVTPAPIVPAACLLRRQAGVG